MNILIKKMKFSYHVYFYTLLFILSKEIAGNLNDNISEIYLMIRGKETQNILSPMFAINPSQVLVNGILKENCTKSCYLDKDENIITLRFDEKIETCEYMFQELNNITEIDFSNFDASKVTNMHSMFYNCSNLEKINFGNINTSKVVDMQSLFNNCSNLISVNLSNFDTSNVNNISHMFQGCENLNYLDLSNFDTLKVININTIFRNCKSLMYLNLKSFNLSSSLEKYYVFDYISSYVKICIEDTVTSNFLLENRISNCSDICFKEGIKIDINNNTCIESCITNGYKYEYDNICYNECPKGTLINGNTCEDNKCKYNYLNNEECKDIIPKGFYLDINDGIYKKCFENCRFCYGPGNETNNNCIECNSNLIFINESIDDTNCYEKCDNFYYFDESNSFHCTENKSCPYNYNKLIIAKNKCIDDCNKDNIYKYEYKNICYEKEQENLETTFIEDKIIISESPNIFESTTNIYQNTDKYNNIEIYNNIVDNIIKEYSPNSEKSKIINGEENIIYQLTTSKNELELLNGNSSDNYNLSIIDLGECEKILRQKYNIADEDFMIYLKQINLTDKESEKNVQLEVYEPYNKTKLNLSYCSGTNYDLYLKIELSPETAKIAEELEKLGYNMFDINDPFYNDICTPYKSSNDTDMLLSDRIDYIYNNSDTKCQSNCVFSGYALSTNIIKCSCNVNENNEEKKDENDKFKPKKIYESFYDVLKYSNYKSLKCFNLVFSKKVFIKNLGSFIILILFLLYLICLTIYIIKGLQPLKEKLDKSSENVKNIKFIKKEKNNNNKNNSHLMTNNLRIYQKRNSINSINSNPIIIPHNQIIKGHNKKVSKFSKAYKNNLNNNEIPKSHYKKKKKDNNKISLNLENESNNQSQSNQNGIKSSKLEDIENQSSSILYKEEQVYILNNLDDFELNELEYDMAVKYDKRSLIQIYFSYLKREIILIFAFFICDDYNLSFIKIARFIFLVSSNMALNVFFFSDESMHKLFLNYGKYNFIQQIPQIIYSTVISQLIEVFLCFLSLTDSHIYQIKKYKDDIENKKKILNVFRCISIKIFYFFLFTFIFFVVYWYLVSSFCSVYQNTQIVFIKDSLGSFLLSLAYSFLLYLFPSCLRVCAIRDKNMRCKCIFKLSDIIPFF